jgi:hypothetical protein
MIEAAVAYFQATGKRKFLDIAIRATDQMDSVSGPGKLRQVSGHEEIELALVKLWRVTGDDKYLALSRFMIDGRGHMEGRSPRPDGSVKLWGEYCQDHKPVREQTEILGHAVRAMYLYSGVADIAAIDNDTGYINAMDLIWRDVTGSKMYITGGIGPSARNEGFTVPYDLPNETAYCETCAAIGMAFWNQRLALLHADAKYADIVERVMYNGALSGVSLNGEKYFYVNPLASAGRHHRQPWHACACCPTNIVRFLPAVGGYAYATGPNGIYVNQYIAGKARMKVNGSGIALTVITEYPWDGLVGIAVELESETAFALFLRIPGWAQACDDPDALYRAEQTPDKTVTLKVNGDAAVSPIEQGYLRVERTWRAGDVVELVLSMPLQRMKAHPRVQSDVGRVALQRGPIVYCAEGVDNPVDPRGLALPPHTRLEAKHRDDLLAGVTVIEGKALAKPLHGAKAKQVKFMAVPYYAWDNRAPGPMAVWLAEGL